MFKSLCTLMIAAALAACGGGSGGGATTAAAPSPGATTPGGAVVSAPPVPAGAVSLTAGSFTEGSNSQVVRVNFTGAANLTLSGQLNQIWLSAAQPGGTATVSGDLNTVVFMPGVDSTLTVTGTGNTFYLPVGSTINAVGSGAASSTIKYYNP